MKAWMLVVLGSAASVAVAGNTHAAEAPQDPVEAAIAATQACLSRLSGSKATQLELCASAYAKACTEAAQHPSMAKGCGTAQALAWDRIVETAYAKRLEELEKAPAKGDNEMKAVRLEMFRKAYDAFKTYRQALQDSVTAQLLPLSAASDIATQAKNEANVSFLKSFSTF